MKLKEQKAMTDIQRQIRKLSWEHGLRLIYAFGSRAGEIMDVAKGKRYSISPSKSDIDIGILSHRPLSVEGKVKIALFFEDLFGVAKTDVVDLSEAPVSLAFEIVQGELLYAEDPDFEAEYQLHVLRMAADLMPYERRKREMVLGIQP
jgi:predicted nucleotidyltransferase